jgi:hypothetical protein
MKICQLYKTKITISHLYVKSQILELSPCLEERESVGILKDMKSLQKIHMMPFGIKEYECK